MTYELPVFETLEKLKPTLADLAQDLYDEWETEPLEDFSERVADAFVEAIRDEFGNLIKTEIKKSYASADEYFYYVLVENSDGDKFQVELPYYHYASWSDDGKLVKVSNVEISESDIIVEFY